MKIEALLQSLPKGLRRDGEIILAHLLKRKPGELFLKGEEVSPRVRDEFFRLLERRMKGEPTAYLIGEWDFFGRTFKVSAGVLVPRPETEILVERVLCLLPPDRPIHGLEIGGGTGCVGITLLLERENLTITMTDIEERALKLIRENAAIYGVEHRLEVLWGDLFAPVEGRKFDFIISNPPYIPRKAWENLPAEVKVEGYTSVVGGERGDELIEAIIAGAREHLHEGGFIALEIGHDQGETVETLFRREGFKAMIYKDYLGQDRVAIGWS